MGGCKAASEAARPQLSNDDKTKGWVAVSITTSDRVLGVLGLFTIEQPEWTVESAAAHLDLAVSTAYRYFRSLSKAGLLVAHATGRYVLGPAFIQYDRQIRLHDPLTTAAQPVMKRLTQELPPHTVVLLCRLFRDQVMCVHQEFAERPDFAVSYERGRPMPLFRGAASKAILAHMPLRAVKSVYDDNTAKFAQASLGKDWSAVKERLRALRNAGLSVTQAELDPGMSGIAVPVFEAQRIIIGSLSVVIPVRYLTPEGLEQISGLLKEGSAEISWALSLSTASPEYSARPILARPSKKRRAASREDQNATSGRNKTTTRERRRARI